MLLLVEFISHCILGGFSSSAYGGIAIFGNTWEKAQQETFSELNSFCWGRGGFKMDNVTRAQGWTQLTLVGLFRGSGACTLDALGDGVEGISVKGFRWLASIKSLRFVKREMAMRRGGGGGGGGGGKGRERHYLTACILDRLERELSKVRSF